MSIYVIVGLILMMIYGINGYTANNDKEEYVITAEDILMFAIIGIVGPFILAIISIIIIFIIIPIILAKCFMLFSGVKIIIKK